MVKPAHILVGGGSGFIGRHLVSQLRSSGAKVQVITRKPAKTRESLAWTDIKNYGLPKQTTSVVNLAGRNIMDPQVWTESFRREIYESRIGTNKILVDAIHAAEHKPDSFVTISGVGYYKPDLKDQYDEGWTQPEHKQDRDYLMNLAHDWEKSSELSEQLAPDTRRVVIRAGVVLGPDGGVIANLKLPFSLGLGGPLGDGKQWFPWIHVEDLVEMFKFAIINSHVTGVINGVAPEQVRNAEFASSLGRALNRKAIVPVPSLLLNFTLSSDRADILLKGQRVTSRAGLLGFRYKYPQLQTACNSCVEQG